MTQSIGLIETAAAASAALAAPRAAILKALREPGSASSVARRLGLPRQRIAYHVRELERHGLVEHVGDKRRGNCTERVVRATARQFLISPQVLGAVAADPQSLLDRHSSAYLVATAARLASDVGRLQARSTATRKRLPTLTLEADVRFSSAEAQQQFSEGLAEALARLISRFHDADTPGGRRFRFVIAGHPSTGHTRPAPGEDNES